MTQHKNAQGQSIGAPVLDWPRIKAGFEAWLAPENFDANGVQKSPLAVARPD